MAMRDDILQAVSTVLEEKHGTKDTPEAERFTDMYMAAMDVWQKDTPPPSNGTATGEVVMMVSKPMPVDDPEMMKRIEEHQQEAWDIINELPD